MKVILISGKARSGKDALGTYLNKEIRDSIIFAFSEKVKDVASNFGWDGEKDIKGRTLLQNIGDTGRAYNTNIWSKEVIESIRIAHSYDYNTFIITDCRYESEIKYIKSCFDTTTIRIERFGHNNGLADNQKNHSSETDLDTYEFDYVIHNNSTMDALEQEAKYIAKEIMR